MWLKVNEQWGRLVVYGEKGSVVEREGELDHLGLSAIARSMAFTLSEMGGIGLL